MTVSELVAGIDGGKAHYHCVAMDSEGRQLLSRRVANDELPLLELIDDVAALAGEEPVTWAVDLNCGGAALLIALLVNHGQRVLSLPGRSVHHAAVTSRGNGKTDAKDAAVPGEETGRGLCGEYCREHATGHGRGGAEHARSGPSVRASRPPVGGVCRGRDAAALWQREAGRMRCANEGELLRRGRGRASCRPGSF